MKLFNKKFAVSFLSCFILCIAIMAPAAMAEDDPAGIMDVKLAKEPTKLDKGVEKSLDHIFNVLNEGNDVLDVAQLSTMLDFVVNMTTDPKDIAPKKRYSGNGICLRKEVKSDLDRILRYFYNKDIPDQLLCPAVLRVSDWYEDSEFLQLKRPLWDELKELGDTPFIVRGTQFEVNTPDSFAGSYYRYDLNRMIILLKYQGKNIAISVSHQDKESDEGRKGAIINDKEWDYFYSGIEGLNKGMIGWMDTYMYKSASVQIFVEDDAAAPKTSVFLFKWLKAGWAGLNVVKRKHIYDGSLRYARSFAKVLESNMLTPEELVANMKGVNALSESELNTLIEEYSKNFEARFKNTPKFKDDDEYADVIANGGYAKVLDVESRRAIIALERLKSLVGLETLVDLSSIAVDNPASESDATAVVEAETPES